MNALEDQGPQGTAQDNDTGNLNTCRRRARTAATDHEQHEDALGKARPLVVIGRDKTSRSNRRCLKGRVADGRKEIDRKGLQQIGGNAGRSQAEDEQVGLKFRISADDAKALAVKLRPKLPPARTMKKVIHPSIAGLSKWAAL